MTDYKTPPLPDRQFFRVTKAYIKVLGPYYVTLRQKTWYGSKKLEGCHADNPADIHSTMRYLKRLHNKKQTWNRNPNLLGDYPPKTLETK